MKGVGEKRTGKIGMGLTLVGIFLCAFVGLTWAAESKPQYGGTLTYAVADAPPSFDAHRESTYAVIHPVSPHYSLLLKFDPNNYPKDYRRPGGELDLFRRSQNLYLQDPQRGEIPRWKHPHFEGH